MAMTDRELCKAVLGWHRNSSSSYTAGCLAWSLPNGDTSYGPPDFANDIEWAMKLADMLGKKHGFSLERWSSPADGWAAYVGRHIGIDDNPAAAIRAAVVKVCEAHKPESPPLRDTGYIMDDGRKVLVRDEKGDSDAEA